MDEPQPGRWWVAVDDQPLGPYDFATMRGYVQEGRVSAFTRVCRDGTTDWIFASTVSELEVPAPPPDSVGVIYPTGVPGIVMAACYLSLLSVILVFLGPIALTMSIFAVRRARGCEAMVRVRAWIGVACSTLSTLILALILVGLALT